MYAAIYWGGLVGLAILAWLGVSAWRRAKMRRIAMTESCLLCDSEEVDQAADELSYRCRQCAYDSTWSEHPALTSQIETFRDLKNALFELRAGEKLMRKAQRTATMEIGGGGGQKYVVLEEATAKLNEALRLLSHLVETHPELLAMPVPVENIDHDLAFRDLYRRGIVGLAADLKVLGRIKEARQQVEAFSTAVQHLSGQLRDDIVRAGAAA